jgi:hypothetical protein
MEKFFLNYQRHEASAMVVVVLQWLEIFFPSPSSSKIPKSLLTSSTNFAWKLWISPCQSLLVVTTCSWRILQEATAEETVHFRTQLLSVHGTVVPIMNKLMLAQFASGGAIKAVMQLRLVICGFRNALKMETPALHCRLRNHFGIAIEQLI